MGHRSEMATPQSSEDESGDAFTDGDFGDTDEDIIEKTDIKSSHIPVTEAKNEDVTKMNGSTNGHTNDSDEEFRINGAKISESHSSDAENHSFVLSDLRRDSHSDQSPSIVGILGGQQNHVQEDAGDLHGLSQATTSRICNRVARALARYSSTYIKMPTSLAEEQKLMMEFRQIRNFPSVIGCIDCTHIKIKKHGGDLAQYYINRKGFYSLNVQAEQRLAARRAARAEAREIRMRELERQQREQEDHADKAYDMYAETVGRRDRTRLAALSPASSVHSPRRSSEDSVDDVFSIKDLRHEMKEVEEKFRKAMILNAQLDNDKAALGYQLELLKDRIEELHEEYAQLQREHKEKCSSLERLKREHEAVVRELGSARDAVRARDCAAAAAGFAFVEAAALANTADDDAPPMAGIGQAVGSVPPLALVSHHAEQLLNDAGEGTLDVRLQNLLSSKQSLESEVRKLKLQLNEERAARQNGVANHHDQEYENELETARKSAMEAKGRAARAEAEAALNAAHVARLEAQLARLKARQDHQDEHEEQLKQERRKLQREAREALNRVEELETENSHLTKRLDKLKNAKSALLKDL